VRYRGGKGWDHGGGVDAVIEAPFELSERADSHASCARPCRFRRSQP
jgi:hypothetical protein